MCLFRKHVSCCSQVASDYHLDEVLADACAADVEDVMCMLQGEGTDEMMRGKLLDCLVSLGFCKCSGTTRVQQHMVCACKQV